MYNSLKHADMETFYNSLPEEVHEKATPFPLYENGSITNSRQVIKNENMSISMMKCADGIRWLFNRLNKVHPFQDDDLSPIRFEYAALFELNLRVHLNKDHSLNVNRITLENVIETIAERLEFSNEEKNILHDGRRFLNLIKHPNNLRTTWEEELEKFHVAYELLLDKGLIYN